MSIQASLAGAAIEATTDEIGARAVQRMHGARRMSTAKLIGLSLDEFWEMDPMDYRAMCGYYLESRGKKNPYRVEYIDE